jgi:outer membrane protein
MNNTRRAAALALVLSALGAAPAFAQGGLKIGFVNRQEVLGKIPGRAAYEDGANKELSGLQERLQAQLKVMDDSLKAMVAEYQKAQPTMAATAREARERQLQLKQQEFENRAQQLQMNAQQRNDELVSPLRDEVQRAVDEVRQAEGLVAVFDVGSQVSQIASYDKSLDITDKVVAKLRPVALNGAAGAAKNEPAKPTAGAKPAPAGITRKPPAQ